MPHNIKKGIFICSPHGELEVPGDDARLLVVPGGVPGELEDLGGEVVRHGGHVHGVGLRELAVLGPAGRTSSVSRPQTWWCRHVRKTTKPVAVDTWSLQVAEF